MITAAFFASAERVHSKGLVDTVFGRAGHVSVKTRRRWCLKRVKI